MSEKVAADVLATLDNQSSPERAAHSARFFKSGAGQYADGDKFLGVTVPQIRMVARQYKDLSLHEVANLLRNDWHEARLCALIILVYQYKQADGRAKMGIYDLYLSNTKFINNWDLVDTSAEYIVGAYLDNRPERLTVLLRLAASDLLWDRRIAILATFAYIKAGRAGEALIVAEQLLHDKHDLIQKAVGWMLREIGKRVDSGLLIDFLEANAATMPRVTLRYAIEHFSQDKRKYFLEKRKIEL